MTTDACTNGWTCTRMHGQPKTECLRDCFNDGWRIKIITTKLPYGKHMFSMQFSVIKISTSSGYHLNTELDEVRCIIVLQWRTSQTGITVPQNCLQCDVLASIPVYWTEVRLFGGHVNSMMIKSCMFQNKLH